MTPTARFRVALAGNPNAGKSTVFNALTGAHQHVGNWPGKTVEKKEGFYRYRGLRVEIVDLPGTYSLSAYSPEERIAQEFITEEHPDVVVNVVDASNLERNLYLTAQLLEIGAPMIIVLNMADVAEQLGYKIDVGRFAQLVGVPVLTAVASKDIGIEALREQIHHAAEAPEFHTPPNGVLQYDHELEKSVRALTEALESLPDLQGYRPRWLAVKLIEGDEQARRVVQGVPGGEKVLDLLQKVMRKLQRVYGEDVDIALADARYAFVRGLARQVLTLPKHPPRTFSDHIDRIVTNRWLGIPLFLFFMYLMFSLVQNVSAPFMDWIDQIINGPITTWTLAGLLAVHAPPWLISLVVDGAIAGVGSVLTFIPSLMVMFFALAFMEDSGYLARAAFVMDKAMAFLGLNGRAFIPMILGFGCNVPAVYATRTIENRAARVLTGLLIPFMSCSARLPVYVVFGMAFFGKDAGLVVWGLYLVGIVVAALAGWVLSLLVFTDVHKSVFVLELPRYRLPTWQGLWLHTWEHTSEFIRKAGTVIFAISLFLWLLLNLPWGVQNPAESYFGKVSHALAPVYEPAGFGTWQAAGALISGFVAKEVVISTMSQIYVGEQETRHSTTPPTLHPLEDARTIVVGFGQATWEAFKSLLDSFTPGVRLFPQAEGDEGNQTELSRALHKAFTPLSALAFLVYVLLYTPCMATVAAQAQEYGWQWAAFSVGLGLTTAWVLATAVFQVGRLLGAG